MALGAYTQTYRRPAQSDFKKPGAMLIPYTCNQLRFYKIMRNGTCHQGTHDNYM